MTQKYQRIDRLQSTHTLFGNITLATNGNITFPDGSVHNTAYLGAGSGSNQQLGTGDSVQFNGVRVDGNLLFKGSTDNTDPMYITKNDLDSNLSVLEIYIGDDGGGYEIAQPTGNYTDYLAIKATNGDFTGIKHLFSSDGYYTVATGIKFGSDSWVQAEPAYNTISSATAPDNTRALWYNTTDGRLYINYGSQWIDASPTQIPLTSTYLGNLTVDGNLIYNTDALTNGVGLVADAVRGSVTAGYSFGDDVTLNLSRSHLYLDGVGTWSVGSNHFATEISSFGDGPGADPLNIGIAANEHTWIFKSDGNLQLPASQTIIDGSGNDLLAKPPGNELINGSYTVILQSDGILNATLGPVKSNLFEGTGSNVEIVAGSYTWTFDTDGNITGTDTEVTITANSGIQGNTWTFTADGNITLPTNVSSINYANGQSILSGVGGAGGDGFAYTSTLDAFAGDFTVTNQQIVLVYNNGPSTHTITLPASPAPGQTVTIKKVSTFSSWVVTVDGNGHNIDASSSLTFNNAFGYVTLVYTTTGSLGSQWFVVGGNYSSV